MKNYSLILLPGMDGTGQLFESFSAILPQDLSVQIISYSSSEALGYDELFVQLRAKISKVQPYFLIAESFSGPLAIRLASERPEGLQALVLVASFATRPTKFPAWLLAAALKFLPLPSLAVRYFLLGRSANQHSIRAVKDVIKEVSPKVLAHRIRAVLAVNVHKELAKIEVPILLLVGESDRLISSKSQRDIQQTTRAPLKIRTIPNAPHLVLQSEPRAAWQAIETWMSALNH